MKLLKCTPKQLIWLFILISLSMFAHVWYLQHLLGFANNMSSFLSQTHNTLFEKPVNFQNDNSKYVLFWNGSPLNNETVHCAPPGDNCVFKVNNNSSESALTYNAVIFNGEILNSNNRPKARRENQLYIFWTLQSSAEVRICETNNNNFFNWTFTYRLDSTIIWPTFVVYNIDSGVIVAPNKSVVWKQSNKTIKNDVKQIIIKKKKVLAWIMKNCKNSMNRDLYVYDLREQMAQFGLFMDVYGPCTNNKCTDGNCSEMIKQDYYFYAAFEDISSVDFVTEKVLDAYKNYAVPVVFGGANYSWFLPEGSYLNANKLHPYTLAFEMKEAFNNLTVYESYFAWRNDYDISPYLFGHHPLCQLCAALNEDRAKHAPAIVNFTHWWNTPENTNKCKEILNEDDIL